MQHHIKWKMEELFGYLWRSMIYGQSVLELTLFRQSSQLLVVVVAVGPLLSRFTFTSHPALINQNKRFSAQFNRRLGVVVACLIPANLAIN